MTSHTVGQQRQQRQQQQQQQQRRRRLLFWGVVLWLLGLLSIRFRFR